MSAVIAEAQTINMPLNMLRTSPLNVRKRKTDVSDLKASIKNHGGLIQNLVVTIAEDGFGEVVAGGRRLAALQELANDGVFDPDAPIAVKVVPLEEALAVSTAENVVRKNMTAIEKINAYKAQVDAGRSVEQVAEAFNVSVNTIRRHVALASAAPAVLTALEEGKITVSVAEAICFSPDHAVQEQVLSSHGNWSASSILRMMMEQKLSADDSLARFVGEEAYVAAGGEITKSLFVGEDGGDVWEDAALVRSLALSKLQALAQPYADAGYTTIVRDPADRSYHQRQRSILSLSDEDLAAMIESPAALAAAENYRKACDAAEKAEELLQEIDSEADPEGEAAAHLLYEAENEAMSVAESKVIAALSVPDAFKHEFRAHVTFTFEVKDGSCDAEPTVPYGYKPTNSTDELVAGVSTPSAAATGSAAGATDGDSISARLKSKLSAHRNAAVQLAVASNPVMAKSMLIQSLLTQAVPNHCDKPWEVCRPLAMSTNITTSSTAEDWNGFSGAESDYPLQPLHDRLASLLDGKPEGFAESLSFIAQLDAAASDEVLAILTGLLTHSHFTSNANQKEIHEAFAVNLSDTFKPNVGNYFGGLKREQIIADVKEAGVAGDEADIAALRAMKTKELAAEATNRVAATGWVPKALKINNGR